MTVTDMLDMAGKPRWTAIQDYHPHIVSVSHHVHRSDSRFTVFDRGAPICLPNYYRGK